MSAFLPWSLEVLLSLEGNSNHQEKTGLGSDHEKGNRSRKEFIFKQIICYNNRRKLKDNSFHSIGHCGSR